MSERVDLAVVGAGAAGLAAGLEARALGAEVAVLEASDRAGGVMRSERIAGHLVERGPNTIQVKAPARALLQREGLEGLLVKAAPASRRRHLLRGGALLPVPMSPWAFAATPLLSARGKLRLLAEPFVRRGDAADESVAAFAGRRLGGEVVDALIGPFLTGVYAGDERALGAEAVFPALVAHEREHGSIVRGALRAALRRRGTRGLPGTWSAPGGLGDLAARLGAALGPALRPGHRVVAVAAHREGVTLEVEGPQGPQRWRARRAVLATDAPAAAALLRGVDAEAEGALRALRHAPIVSVSLSAPREALAAAADGFGFLVPRGEPAQVLGVLFMSALFPGRAPPGRVLLTAMLGGVRSPELVEAPEEALREALRGDLGRILGLRAEPQWLAATRWPRAVPQPAPGHPARMGTLAARLAPRGLALAGSYVAGVGVSDTLASGRAAADTLLARP